MIPAPEQTQNHVAPLPAGDILPVTGTDLNRQDGRVRPYTNGNSATLDTIRRNGWLILGLILCGAAAGTFIALLQPPVYEARASLEILALNEDFLNMKQSSPTTTNDGSYDSSELQTEVQLLTSNSILDQVSDKLHRAGDFKPAEPVLKMPSWTLLKSAGHDQTSGNQRLIANALDSIKARVRSRTRLIDVSVDSSDPLLATQAANALTKEFIEQSVEARWQAGQSISEWLTRELGDLRKRLKKSEDDLQSYARNSGLVFTEQDANVSDTKLLQLQQELSTATADRIVKQSRYESAQASSPDSLPDVLGDPSLRETASKITDAKRQLAEMSTVFNSGYSKVKRTEAELQVLEAAFEKGRASILYRIKNEYLEAARREKLLQSAYSAQVGDVTKDKEKFVQYSMLKSEVDSSRHLYDSLLQQLQQASVTSAMRAGNVRVVDVAQIPDTPISPSWKKNSVLGILGGLFLGIWISVTRERYNQRLRDPGDIRFWTKLPELGLVPKAILISQTKPRKALGVSPLHLGAARQLLEPRGMEIYNSRSDYGSAGMLAEAFRGILTSIFFSEKNGFEPRLIVITSAIPSEGKTTVVSNLAMAMASTGKEVLVIDADLRRPRIHTLFDVPNAPGLVEYLKREPMVGASLQRTIQKTAVRGVDVLTSGSTQDGADHLLHSPRLRQLAAEARAQYDVVLIDSPPIQMTAARLVGRLSDAAIIVARAERTTRDQILAVKQQLREDGITVLGAILNDWDPKKSRNAYYKSYYSGAYSSYIGSRE